jgi:hypothetical protein
MGYSGERYMDEQEEQQQAQESEVELFYAIIEALQAAKNHGLEEDHLKVLSYAAGIDYSTLEN